MNRNDIVKAVADSVGIGQRETREVLARTLDLFVRAIVEEGGIEVRGLGTFSVRKWKARVARDPRTGEAIEVPPRKVVKFRAGKRLERLLRKR